MRLAVPATDPMLGYVARTGVIVSVEDASIDPRFNVDLVNMLLSVVAAQVQQDIISQRTYLCVRICCGLCCLEEWSSAE